MTKKILIPIFALAFLLPTSVNAIDFGEVVTDCATYGLCDAAAAAGFPSTVLNLGNLSDTYYGDTLQISWGFGGVGEIARAKLSVYLENRTAGTLTRLAAGKSSQDSIVFIVPSSVPKDKDYRVIVTLDNSPSSVLARTGWFKILGARVATFIGTSNTNNTSSNFINEVDDTKTRIKRFNVDSRKNGDVRIDWRTDGRFAEVSSWVTCSQEMTFYEEETGVSYDCKTDVGKRLFNSIFENKSGSVTLKPINVTKSTTAKFKLYVIDGFGDTIDYDEKNKSFKPIEGSTSSNNNSDNEEEEEDVVNNSISTGPTSSSEQKVNEIIILAEVLELDIDIDLIRLLVVLGIL